MSDFVSNKGRRTCGGFEDISRRWRTLGWSQVTPGGREDSRESSGASRRSPRVKFSCQIKAAGHLEALRTPTDVWEAGGHIWEVPRTQGGRLKRPEDLEERQGR